MATGAGRSRDHGGGDAWLGGGRGSVVVIRGCGCFTVAVWWCHCAATGWDGLVWGEGGGCGVKDTVSPLCRVVTIKMR